MLDLGLVGQVGSGDIEALLNTATDPGGSALVGFGGGLAFLRSLEGIVLVGVGAVVQEDIISLDLY